MMKEEDSFLNIILQNPVEPPKNKLIIVDFNMMTHKFELSVINDKEYIIVSKDLYVVSCVELLQKLYAEYDKILFDVNRFMLYDIKDLLDTYGLYFDVNRVDRELARIINLNKNSTVLTVYVESRQLNYNENLVKHLLS